MTTEKPDLPEGDSLHHLAMEAARLWAEYQASDLLSPHEQEGFNAAMFSLAAYFKINVPEETP